MTTNQTIDGVPRDRLEDAARAAQIAGYTGLAGELRALLDAPACKTCKGTRIVSDGAMYCSSGGIPFESGPIECVKDCPDCKPAAQPQGEPVAWQYRVSAGPQTGWSLWHDGKGEEFKKYYQVETRPLYAEQPAPVAPTPINYGALDPFERLAVCRGEVAPVAVVLSLRNMVGMFHHKAVTPLELETIRNAEDCLDELKRLNPYL